MQSRSLCLHSAFRWFFLLGKDGLEGKSKAAHVLNVLEVSGEQKFAWACCEQ